MYSSVIVDEATDIANDEQLSICLRFVSGNSLCKFLAFMSASLVLLALPLLKIFCLSFLNGSYSLSFCVVKLMTGQVQCLENPRVFQHVSRPSIPKLIIYTVHHIG